MAVIVTCLVAFGTLGFFIETDDVRNEVDRYLLIFIYLEFYHSMWKLIIFFYNANTVWEVFDVTWLNFMTSKSCCEHIAVMYKSRDKIKKMIVVYLAYVILAVSQWIIFPLMINSIIMFEDNNQRKLNVLDLWYPVTIYTHNQYYVLFYGLEITIVIFAPYILFLIDMYLIIISNMVIAHYEVLIRAFENIGYEKKTSAGNTFHVHVQIKVVDVI